MTAPRHIGLISDGNRRWARNHGLPVRTGFQRGAKKVPSFLEWCEAAGAEVVTVWIMSPQNLRRKGAEVDAMVHLAEELIKRLASFGRWRLRPIGDMTVLPHSIADTVRQAATCTAAAGPMLVNLALAYDGRQDILRALRVYLNDPSFQPPTEEGFTTYLDTGGQPEPDLIIRTSGEQRLSGFLTWQSAQSELYFCGMPWPSFSHKDFLHAMKWFGKRKRRFGR